MFHGMTTFFDTRRYLTDFESARTGNILTDVLIIGSGVAGIRSALEASETSLVTLITKDDFTASATYHAQGGIAIAQPPEDSPERHYEDSMRVGCGMNAPDTLRLLVDEGPECLRELLAWGLPLDRTGGRTHFEIERAVGESRKS